MPLPPFANVCDYVTRIPSRNKPLSADSENPLAHLRRGINDCEKLVAFVDSLMERVRTYRTSRENFSRLCEFAAVGAIEAFERFFKELASSCIDFVYEYVSDDRLDVFSIKGAAAAVHLEAGSVGRGLCESSTWLNNKENAKRFKRILADPNTDGNFSLFTNDGSVSDRQDIVSVLWQLRHSIVHNFGVINKSDAVKLRKLCKRQVDGDCPGGYSKVRFLVHKTLYSRSRTGYFHQSSFATFRTSLNSHGL